MLLLHFDGYFVSSYPLTPLLKDGYYMYGNGFVTPLRQQPLQNLLPSPSWVLVYSVWLAC